MAGFVYPNELELQWGLIIPVYPFITGLVAGAFIVASLYHVFGIARLKPVARLSLIAAFAFLTVCALPLLFHLGHPERALRIFFAPSFTSAMSGFGYIWFIYLIMVAVEVWLAFRKDIVAYAQSEFGVKKRLYSILALGVYDVSEKSLHTDEKIIKALALIGIPTACLLHGYVGFIFGAVKGNPWWSTPLMPLIFLLSAIVSGIAVLLLVYVIVSRVRRAPLDHACVASLAKWLLGFLIVDLVLEVLEVVTMLYESEESWEMISQLITTKIATSYFGIQLGLGALVPIVILGLAVAVRMSDEIRTRLASLSSILIVLGVFAMRYNVVIGGQLVSKSLRGFVSFAPSLLGKEGILAMGGLLAVPFLVLSIMAYLLPPWEREVPQAETPPRAWRPWR